jgi:hypothetical protein
MRGSGLGSILELTWMRPSRSRRRPSLTSRMRRAELVSGALTSSSLLVSTLPGPQPWRTIPGSIWRRRAGSSPRAARLRWRHASSSSSSREAKRPRGMGCPGDIEGSCRSSAKGRQPPQAASARTRFAIQARVENSSHPLADSNRSYLDRFPLKTEPGVLSLERRSLSEQPLPVDARLRLPGCVPSLRTSSRASRAAALILLFAYEGDPAHPLGPPPVWSRFLRDHSEKRPEGCRPTVVPCRGTVGIWRNCDRSSDVCSPPQGAARVQRTHARPFT